MNKQTTSKPSRTVTVAFVGGTTVTARAESTPFSQPGSRKAERMAPWAFGSLEAHIAALAESETR